MNTKQQLAKEQKRLREELDKLFKTLKLDNKLTADWMVKLVYEAGERWGDQAHLLFQKEISKKLNHLKKQEDVFAVIELAFECWNHFPHKDMNDKSPFELARELGPKKPSAENPPAMPDVIVGNQKMSFPEYQAMLEEMERVQVPFRAWLMEDILPKYKKYLETQYKKQTIEKHYSVAEILCGRMLTVGFVSPEHVRSDFLYVEFPLWWQTHVMFGDYNETAVENSVIEFINFIEKTTGVVMDDDYIESDPGLYV